MAERLLKKEQKDTRFNKTNFKRFFRDSILLSLINCIILLGLLYNGENNILKVRRADLEIQAQEILQVENNLIGNGFDHVISDVGFIKENYQNELGTPEGIEKTAREWIAFSDKKKIYDQIRFLDTQGNEVLRINYEEEGAYRVSDNQLQNKADSYYFEDTIGLNPGQIYISRLDLNVENDKVEVPYKPMIRVCTPSYSVENILLGIIVLNYKAEDLLRDFKELGNVGFSEQYLLNLDGYWLSSPDKAQEWTFMFPHKQDVSFQSGFPQEWEKIKAGNDGNTLDACRIIYTENGMFASIHLRIAEQLDNNQSLIDENRVVVQEGEWLVVIHERADGHNGLVVAGNVWGIAKYVLKKYLPIFIIFIVASFIFTYFLCLMRQARNRLAFYSSFDPMTEVYNRRAGIEKLADNIAQQDRRKKAIVLMFVDVNGLKQVNDTFGHKAGDALILTVVNTFKEILRKDDFVIRLGGDEFLVVLCDTDESQTNRVWERITQQFDLINQSENRPYIISASHGTAIVDKLEEISIDDLIKKADEAMYAEKKEIKKHLNVIRKSENKKE